ncbi:hypothetical protein MKX79_03905 [Viridibacillus sp. FSL R5-0468]|uniref:hypothetical protein n=1 Tax=Viridibacillus sp. FSL R5-0468 TaxID=2921640 RepID=UPI0030F884D5
MPLEKTIEQDLLIENHEGRIKQLELNDLDKEKRLRTVEQSYLKLENTILQENRDTRQLFQNTMQNQWDLIKSSYAATENDKNRKYELTKSKLERRTELTMKLLGTGGLLYLCVQSLLDWMSK